MDILAIMAIIAKGIGIAETLISVGKNAAPALTAVKDLVTSVMSGTPVTQEQLTATETSLDAMIADFNTPI